MTVYFVSDLHLHVTRPELTKMFLHFIRDQAQHADALYILGDFFALWLGDDVELPKYPEIIKALQHLENKGIPVYFIHGNRDFLIGKKFSKATGCKILPDPYVLTLGNQRLLLSHGDQLCTLDTGYQKFRKIVQNPIVKFLFLSLPALIRVKIGLWVKGRANRNSNNYEPDNPKYDVTQTAIDHSLDKYNVPIIIHGHTHRPKMSAKHIVLGDWDQKSAKVLAWNTQQPQLIDLCVNHNCLELAT